MATGESLGVTSLWFIEMSAQHPMPAWPHCITHFSKPATLPLASCQYMLPQTVPNTRWTIQTDKCKQLLSTIGSLTDYHWKWHPCCLPKRVNSPESCSCNVDHLQTATSQRILTIPNALNWTTEHKPWSTIPTENKCGHGVGCTR